MEAPLHQFPVPPPPALPLQQALMMAATGNKAAAAGGREQCPRCASRDTKFCYYNNYNTAQPRHFCRACRRYWTLGGSLRNVPVGGSTRKRHRPPRPTRAMAAALAAATATTPTTATTMTASRSSGCGGGPFAAGSPEAATLLQGAGGGLLVSSPLLALGASPLLEGRLGFDLGGLGDADAALAAATADGDDMAHHQQLPLLGAGGTLPWPTATILEGDRTDTTTTTTWKFPFPPAAAALWQELAPAVDAGGLHLHHGAPHLLL